MKRYDATPILTVVMMTLGAVVGYGQATRTSVSAAEVTGTFRMNLQTKVHSSYDEIKIASSGRGKLHVFMDLTYPYKMLNGEDMANTGQLDEEFAIEGDLASYTSEDKQCTITIRFLKPGTIAVNQAGSDAECGFGHNVNASGNYKKVSSAKPKFDQQ